MRLDPTRARRPWRDSDWRHWDESGDCPRGESRRGGERAQQREQRRRRHLAWHLIHHRRHHQGESLGGRLLATFIIASLLSILLAAVALETAFNWHHSLALWHGLGVQADWIESHLVFDPAGEPLALREPADTAWVYTAATRDWKYRVVDGSGKARLSSDPDAPPFAPTAAGFDAYPAARGPRCTGLRAGRRCLGTAATARALHGDLARHADQIGRAHV